MINEKTDHQSFRFFKTRFCLLFLLFLGNFAFSSAQTIQPNYLAPQPPNNNYMKNSAAFRQEIMRMEINVQRGKKTLPITQVPRVSKNDVITLRLSDDPVGGIKPHQSLWDWTFLVAFVNPNRRASVKVDGNWDSGVSQEIQFRKTGWYREYTFTVPYDSQPVFFLYPQPKNRGKILKLIDKNYNEIRKLGEKTIEIAGAYAQISSFLNELQSVLYMSQYSRYANNGIYGGYGTYNPYGASGGYNPYNPYGTQQPPAGVPFNYNVFVEQSIERLAKGFNVALPGCWQNNGNSYNSYGSTNGSQYGSIYGGGYGGGYGNNQNNYGYAVSQDLVNRAQCVAKNIRLEDFDFSVSRLLQQGGVLLAAQLREKYPQLAYWINIAAVAIDFIVKIFQKSPLKIVPTMVQSSDGLGFGSNALGAGGTTNTWGNGVNYGGYNQNSYSSNYPPVNNPNAQNQTNPAAVKLSLYAENQPDDMQFITAYPVVTHKWQAEPDPEVISLYPPVLAEPCLHVGMNVLKNTDLGQSWTEDVYARDFRLVMSDKNGFRKEFPLRKNLGLAGWELNLTQEDLNQIPKISMNLEAEVIGYRGFNEVKSPKFDLPLSTGSNWEITRASQQNFAVGGKRIVTLRNTLGSCLCLQRVIYKPASGGQFVFDVDAKEAGLQFSPDGREASFVIDTTNFPPGMGTLEIKTYGSESQPPAPQQTLMQPGGVVAATTNSPATTTQSATVLNLNLHAPPPSITGVRISKGDRQAILTGERLEQIRAVKINGKRAVAIGNYNQPVQSTADNTSSGTLTWGGAVKQNQTSVSEVGQTQGQTGGLQSIPMPSSSAQNERLVVFENQQVQQIEKVVSLELELEGDRFYQINQSFPVSLSRPAIVINETGEIEADEAVNVLPLGQPDKSVRGTANLNFPLSLKDAFPMNTREISLRVKNSLTDYDFKFENLSVETRIEKSQVNPAELPQASFVVLDWKNLELKFSISESLRQMLGGRRIQFRIRDRERGDSDWFTIKQTFVRTPNVTSIRCGAAMQGNCEMKGDGLEFVAQVSTDGGLTWFPEPGGNLQIQPTRDGQKAMRIPMLLNKKLLQIKLRDYPAVPISNLGSFSFGSAERAVKR